MKLLFLSKGFCISGFTAKSTGFTYGITGRGEYLMSMFIVRSATVDSKASSVVGPST